MSFLLAFLGNPSLFIRGLRERSLEGLDGYFGSIDLDPQVENILVTDRAGRSV